MRVTREENTYPMIPAGQAAREMVGCRGTDGRTGHQGAAQPGGAGGLGSLRTGRKHVLSILVENKSGVLTRIAGLFARRGFNIDTLTVGPTDDDQISRVTLTVDGALHPIDQVTKQLHKLINVLKIRDLEPADTVARELALFKISADGAQRGELMQIAEIFRGKVVDVTKRSVIDRGDGHDREDRGVRGHGPPVRPDRDDAHGRDRDLPGTGRDLARRLEHRHRGASAA